MQRERRSLCSYQHSHMKEKKSGKFWQHGVSSRDKRTSPRHFNRVLGGKYEGIQDVVGQPKLRERDEGEK